MKSEVQRSLAILKNGGLIVYPTDTVWGIGCDATDPIAVNRVYKIKKRSESKSLIMLVSDLEMLRGTIPNIPENIIAFLAQNKKPTSVIYTNPIGLAQNAIASNNTVAIRIVANDFCRKLIHNFGKPIVSTSANISGSPTPTSFSEIEGAILESVDYVVNLQREAINEKSSTIVKLEEDGNIIILRE